MWSNSVVSPKASNLTSPKVHTNSNTSASNSANGFSATGVPVDAYFDDEDEDEEEIELVGGGGGGGVGKSSRQYTGRAGGGRAAVVTSGGAMAAGGATVKMRPNAAAAAAGGRREEYHLQVRKPHKTDVFCSEKLMSRSLFIFNFISNPAQIIIYAPYVQDEDLFKSQSFVFLYLPYKAV